MNETIKNILMRRSVRSYLSKPVPEKDLELILQCGKYAATARGMQPWHLTALSNRALMDKITAENRQIMSKSPIEGIRQLASAEDFDSWHGAPTAIIISGDDNNPFAVTDCANAAQNMVVAAKSLGLGSCYMTSSVYALKETKNNELVTALGVPENYTPLYSLAIGYPGTDPAAASQRKTDCINYVR